MKKFEWVWGFVMVTGLFWAGFGSLVWGVLAGIFVLAMMAIKEKSWKSGM